MFPTALPNDSEALQELLKTLSDQYVELYNEFARIAEHHTDDDGFAVWLTNKTGAPTVQGEVVEAHASTPSAVSLVEVNDQFGIGVFLNSGVVDGAEALVVVGGKALVRADATGFTMNDRLIVSSATAGRVEVSNIPSTTQHWAEIGHALQDAAANALGLAMLHWN